MTGIWHTPVNQLGKCCADALETPNEPITTIQKGPQMNPLELGPSDQM